MACSHRRREPICAWEWPTKNKIGGPTTVYVYHCPSCHGVGVYEANQFVLHQGQIRGKLLYSFERNK
jgi:hypothetical protein